MKNPKTFYEVQRERQWKTYALLVPVWVLYCLGSCIVYVFVVISVVLWSESASAWELVPSFFQANVFIVIVLGSLVLALVHWMDAYFRGGKYILKILGARELDPTDRYHQRLRNVLEEMRLASGLRDVRVMVLPTVAMNAFALCEGRGKTVIGVTEGLLGRLSRSHLEAVLAHEFSHIAKRDILYITMVCSLRNVFARMIEVLEQLGEDVRKELLIFVMRVVEEMMRISSALISRQREYLADATAVEYSRDPLALAEALYIISRNNRWIGGVGSFYSPLFIVSASARSRSESEGFLSRAFSTHPSTQKRINVALGMAHVQLKNLEEEIVRREKKRERARAELAQEEDKLKQYAGIGTEKSRWLAQREGGKWDGPFFLEEIMNKRWLMLDSWVSKIGSSKPVKACNDEEILAAFRRKYATRQGFTGTGECPQCKVLLQKTDYEGAQLLECQSCRGVFTSKDRLRRVLARVDKGFSERLRKKAIDLRKQYYYVPTWLRTKTTKMEGYPERKCPRCGVTMLRRAYSYQYFVMIDYCSLCDSYWFDKDELEILQFLVEEESKPRKEPSVK